MLCYPGFKEYILALAHNPTPAIKEASFWILLNS
jgi:hypothetical protein